jgi:hypothetical protein
MPLNCSVHAIRPYADWRQVLASRYECRGLAVDALAIDRKEMAMPIPVVRGVIDRRILLNFRVDPKVLSRILPDPFRPKLVHGAGMAGVCLIRLRQIRPKFVPAFLGVSSENAAHRIAVEWEQNGQQREGVFIPRRDTSSWLNTIVGGTLFPGLHHHSQFQVHEHDDHYRIVLDSDDRQTHLLVEAHVSAEFQADSIFGSLQEASAFFERGSLGYSLTNQGGAFDGLELRSRNWQVTPLTIEHVESSFFEDRSLFPVGSVVFDSALLMLGIDHEWHQRPSLCASGQIAVV